MRRKKPTAKPLALDDVMLFRAQHPAEEGQPAFESCPTMRDESGAICRPLARTLTTLDSMARRGFISDRQYEAGQIFEQDFLRAAYPTHRALNPMALREGKGGQRGDLDEFLTSTQLDARERVWRALKCLGGGTTSAGLVLWYVVGLGQTVSEFCEAQTLGGRRTDKNRASAHLVSALDCLVAFFGLTGPDLRGRKMARCHFCDGAEV